MTSRLAATDHWAEPGKCGKDRAPLPGRGWSPSDSHSDWQSGWHVYAVEWWSDRLDFFVDGAKYFTRTSSEVALPTAPMFIIFDQAVDAWLFPPSWGPGRYGDGVTLSVDYVRVYESVAS